MISDTRWPVCGANNAGSLIAYVHNARGQLLTGRAVHSGRNPVDFEAIQMTGKDHSKVIRQQLSSLAHSRRPVVIYRLRSICDCVCQANHNIGTLACGLSIAEATTDECRTRTLELLPRSTAQ